MPYLGVVAVLAAANIVVNLLLPGWAYVPFNLLVGGVALWLARRAGATPGDLGLDRSTLRRGVGVGLAVAVAAAAVVTAIAILPLTADFFEDARASGIGFGGLLYQTLLRIPLGTALAEEAAFRGALLGLGDRRWGGLTSAAVSSALFGLWHVVPAASAASGNAITAGASGWEVAGIVAGAVLATAAAGVFFVLVRRWGRHLIAPVLAHATVNSVAFTIAYHSVT